MVEVSLLNDLASIVGLSSVPVHDTISRNVGSPTNSECEAIVIPEYNEVGRHLLEDTETGTNVTLSPSLSAFRAQLKTELYHRSYADCFRRV
jgi:hypothetical protein